MSGLDTFIPGSIRKSPAGDHTLFLKALDQLADELDSLGGIKEKTISVRNHVLATTSDIALVTGPQATPHEGFVSDEDIETVFTESNGLTQCK